MSSQTLREAAEASKAWPFEEARKLIARLKRSPAQRSHLRDRLRALGSAASRHVRRSRAHQHGAARLSRPDRRQRQDQADRLLRRHGRPAQGSRQHPEPRADRRPSRQAADPDPRPVRRIRQLRRSQQCAAARLSRPVRLRIRIHLLDRDLSIGPVRQGAPAHARLLRRGAGDHAAVAARGAGGDLFALPADSPANRSRHAGAGAGARPERRHDQLARSRDA